MRNPCWRRGARAKGTLIRESRRDFARALLLQQGASHSLKTLHTFSLTREEDIVEVELSKEEWLTIYRSQTFERDRNTRCGRSNEWSEDLCVDKNKMVRTLVQMYFDADGADIIFILIYFDGARSLVGFDSTSGLRTRPSARCSRVRSLPLLLSYLKRILYGFF